jgi:Xaa-Pro aminopeptidase
MTALCAQSATRQLDLGAASVAPPMRALLQERWGGIRERLASAGLCGLLVGGHGALHRYGYLEYVAGYCPWRQDGYVVLGLRGTPVLIIPSTADVDGARAVGGSDILQAPATGIAAALGGCLADFDMSAGPIGFVGENADAIEGLLPAGALHDATSLLAGIKARKTAGELAHLMLVSELVDQGMDAFRAALRTGTTMRAVCEEVERTLRTSGARDMIVRLGKGPQFTEPSQSNRIERGQLLCAYVEVLGENGYWVELMRPVAIGEIDALNTRHLRACIEVSKLAERMLRAGTRATELFDMVNDTAQSRGLRLDGGCGHGLGIDDQDPPRLMKEDPTIVEAGVVITVHPRLVDDRTQVGAVVGDTYLVAEDGPCRFSRHDRKVLQVQP